MEVKGKCSSELTKKINELRVLNNICNRCDLGQPIRLGVGNCEAKIMIIGDAPNNELIPFESRNGALIDKILKWLNTNRKQCYLTYLTKCNTKIAQHRKNCDWINQEIEIIKPKLIITFGEKSAKYLLKTKVGLDNVYGVAHNYTWGLVIPLPPIGSILRGKPEEFREVFSNIKI